MWYIHMKVKSLSRVRLFAAPWTVAYQAPLSMGSSRQEYWSGLPLPSPSDRSSYLLDLSVYLSIYLSSVYLFIYHGVPSHGEMTFHQKVEGTQS